MGDDRDRSTSPHRRRDKGKERERERDSEREKHREKDRDREHRRERDRDRSDRHHDRDRDRDHKDRDRDRDRDRSERHHDRNHEHDRSERHRDRDREREHKRDRERETSQERRERKREKREREERREEKRARREREKRRDGMEVVDDDEAGMWVEKGGEVSAEAVGSIPTADSLPLKSTAVPAGQRSPPARATEDQPGRDAWMLEPGESAGGGGGDDFFGSFGTAIKRKENLKPEPQTMHSKYELNTQYLEGKAVDEYKAEEKKTTPGGPGYQWRMMKLRRLYEQAEEQGRPVEEVALERYGSMDEFNEAVEERRFLDERESRRRDRGGNPRGGRTGEYSSASPGVRTPTNRFVFNNPNSDESRPASRQGFRRPGEERDRDREGGGGATPRLDALKRSGAGPSGASGASGSGQLKGATPIPSVFTPQALTRGGSSEATKTASDGRPVFSLEQLNRLQAKVLRAKLTDDPDAEALEEQYERERARFDEAGGQAHTTGNLVREDENGNNVQVEVLPTLDGQGRLYDVGLGAEDAVPAGKRKKDPKFESRDKQGNIIRYNADDDDVTLGELVRQEKFGGGANDMKNMDAELAAQISRDGRFQSDLDYMDDNSERLARKRMKTDAMKRAFAINDYKRTKKALDECPFCYQDDRQPLTAVVALGKRTYLCCTTTEELVPGHCLIVPLQHCLSTLELDDDDWDEIRNFMKCLMQMFAAENKGVVFYETILSFRQQRHTFIECVPLPANEFADAPGYFRQSILASESEWSQHKKLIDFSTRPGGFRRMLVPNMPYFMVQFDYRGEKGYGHIIEGIDDMREDEDGGMDEGDKGGGKFPPYFAAEIIGNILDLEPRLWRRPKRIDYSLNKERARALGTKFQPYNWTVM